MPRRGRWLRLVAGVFVLALVGGCRDETDGGRPPQGLILQADRLFDGVDMATDLEVLIRDDRIVDVGPSGSLDGGRRVDLGDATILPGFIDLHVHLEATEFDDFVRTGVTTVRDLGKAVITNASDVPEPGFIRLIEAGPLLGPHGGAADVWWGEVARLVDTPKEARVAVADLAGDGADVIKAYLGQNEKGTLETFDDETLSALVDEAHDAELEVTAHIDAAAGVRQALAAGVDQLAHIPCFHVSGGLLDRLVDDDIPAVGTLALYRRICPASGDNARRFVASGGSLLYGTDYASYRRHGTAGLDTDELRSMQEAGLTPQESLSAATALAGDVLGSEGLGRLIAGAPADLMVVEGDPLDSIDALAEPMVVIAGGKIVVGDRLLSDQPRTGSRWAASATSNSTAWRSAISSFRSSVV